MNTGKIDKRIMAVHHTAISFDGSFRTLLQSELYLLKSWHDDHECCCAAKTPDEVVYLRK